MQISALRKNLNSNRISVFTDGEYTFSIELNTLIKEGLYVGQNVSNEQILSIKKLDKKEYLIRRAVSILSRRPRSRYELELYLDKKIFEGKTSNRFEDGDESITKEVLEELESKGLVDDQAFAKALYADLIDKKRYSSKQIAIKLLQRGVKKGIVEALVNSEDTKGIDKESVQKLIAKHKSRISHKAKSEKEYIQKMGIFLHRKGYTWDLINKHL